MAIKKTKPKKFGTAPKKTHGSASFRLETIGPGPVGDDGARTAPTLRAVPHQKKTREFNGRELAEFLRHALNMDLRDGDDVTISATVTSRVKFTVERVEIR